MRDLDVTTTVFIKAIRDRTLLSKEEVFALFANTEKLMEIHTDFLDVRIVLLCSVLWGCCVVLCCMLCWVVLR